jgi:hypothetical protein
MPAQIAELSDGRRRLLRLMRELHFGSIEELEIRGGEPIFDPAPRVVREIKFGGENDPRPEAAATDLAAKTQVTELLDSLTAIGDGTIGRLEVKHGIPFRMRLEALSCA